MTPVAIGDTQGTLQARKTWFAMYKRPETFLRLHKCYQANSSLFEFIILSSFIFNVNNDNIVYSSLSTTDFDLVNSEK